MVAKKGKGKGKGKNEESNICNNRRDNFTIFDNASSRCNEHDFGGGSKQ
jgi:hypothetical protein